MTATSGIEGRPDLAVEATEVLGHLTAAFGAAREVPHEVVGMALGGRVRAGRVAAADWSPLCGAAAFFVAIRDGLGTEAEARLRKLLEDACGCS